MGHRDWAAVVFDVDGTLVDSERDGHRVAFNEAFAASGLPYRWDVAEYGRLLSVTGGQRRLAAFLESRGHDPDDAGALAARLHQDKTRRMRDCVERGAIAPRAGVRELLGKLTAAGVTLAVATTGSRDWVEPLLTGIFGADMFAAVVTGSDVSALKPDPEAYVEVIGRLGVPADRTLAVEDSRNGLRAALAAGMDCVVVANEYTRDEDFGGAAAVYPGFAECLADQDGPLLGGVGAGARLPSGLPALPGRDTRYQALALARRPPARPARRARGFSPTGRRRAAGPGVFAGRPPGGEGSWRWNTLSFWMMLPVIPNGSVLCRRARRGGGRG